ISVLLVGQREALGDVGKLDVLEASEVIEMGEEPATSVRRKRDSSVVRAAEAVRDGQASAMVSAGNTGAAVAAALLRIGRITGVQRPGIATVLPVPGGKPTVLLDSGANSECSAAWLAQFAQMGAVLANRRFGIAQPRVGLLSIGEEATKGTPLVKEAHALLSEPDWLESSGGRFIGNVEGRDVLTDVLDVVVTDGFTGNVVLKTLEGSIKVFVEAVLGVMGSTEEIRKASDVVLPALMPLYRELDPETYGGAMLLGIDGVCIIGHGKSSTRAIVNAVRVAADMVSGDLVGRLRGAVGRHPVPTAVQGS
ncbi:MAG: phosphate acyltransferase PlsX, partial [Actinobacteria bacterium]|nr:phosphate acyltransferase PlsX [Actinomycetota bacterium]